MITMIIITNLRLTGKSYDLTNLLVLIMSATENVLIIVSYVAPNGHINLAPGCPRTPGIDPGAPRFSKFPKYDKGKLTP